ncbi:hypothetical protein KKG72_10360 [bacterium]|nr:hypothetical protein [bacterium]MBU1994453.1 hypothetical protein [bacterium]
MKFNNKLKTLFLDPEASVFTQDEKNEKVNLILSPSLYWVKKLSLPVKYIREVKKLLPSIFEDTLPAGKYSYSAYKVADEFFVFAYEDKLILDTMAQKGIVAANVANVYFAQSELWNIEGALRINESQNIYVKDGIVVLVPGAWTKECENLEINELTLSQHSIVLEQFGHIVDKSSLYKIAAIIVILSLLVGTEYFITAQKTEEILELKDELFTKYGLKSTMMQNESMLKKFDSIHKKQMKLREYASYILTLKLNSGEKISQINMKNNSLEIDFTGIQKGKDSHISNMLKSKNISFNIDYKDSIMHLEMSL